MINKNIFQLLSNILLKTLLLGSLVIVHSQAHALCEFDPQAEAYDYDSVMDCFQSVPFNPPDLQNIIDVIEFNREGISSLRSVYDARNQWRSNLSTLRNQSFNSDFEMHEALKAEALKFKNGHFFYQSPSCYLQFAAAYIPIRFNSMMVGRKQIIYVSNTLFDEAYLNLYGINAQELVGKKLVAIDGVPVLKYFRQFGKEQLRGEDDGTNLNRILNELDFSIRVGGSIYPKTRSHTYTFSGKHGKKFDLELPWAFYNFPLLTGFNYSYPTDAQSFAGYCFIPNPISAAFPSLNTVAERQQFKESANVSLNNIQIQPFKSPEIRDKHKHFKKKILKKIYRKYKSGGQYQEVPAGLENKFMTLLFENPDVKVQQYKDKTTVIRLEDFSLSQEGYINDVYNGTQYACEHSDKLIFDLRSNGGGFIRDVHDVIVHLFPEREQQTTQSNLIGRYITSPLQLKMMVNDFLFSFYFSPLIGLDQETCYRIVFPPYATGPVTSFACNIDPNTNQIFGLSNPFWFANFTQEIRGNDLETLSPIRATKVYDIFEPPPPPPIACPGKFSGENLILVTNGTNGSAGYFFPELIKDKATIVTTGGFVNEPMLTGAARGGNVVSANDFTNQFLTFETFIGPELNLAYGAPLFTPWAAPFPIFNREVDTTYEYVGYYLPDLSELMINTSPRADVRVKVWTLAPETDGYVIQEVLKALKRDAK